MIMPQNKNKSVSVRKTDAEADNKKSENKPQADIRFKKDNLVTSARYIDKKDVVNAVLEDGKEYTLAEVDELIRKFMKGKVR